MTDQFNTDLDDLEDVLDDGNDDGAGVDSDDGSSQDGTDDPKDKRIADLMSKWQKEEARANELEKKLKGAADAQGAGSSDGDAPDQSQQWIELIREQAREQIFASDPRLAAAGLDSSSVTGDTPSEMKEAAAQLSALIEKVSATAQAAALKKHGLSPEVKSSPAGQVRSYGQMSDEEFEKELAKAKDRF